MIEKSSIRFCYFTTFRTRQDSKVPGNPIKEITKYSQLIQDATLVHFHSKATTKILQDNARIITIPFGNDKTWFGFGSSIIRSYLNSVPKLIKLVKQYRSNIIRCDDIIISGLPTILASKVTKVPCVVALLGDEEQVIRFKIGKSSMLGFVLKIFRKISRYVISNASGVIVLNQELKKVAESYGAKSIFHAYPYVDLSLFLPKPETNSHSFTVLFVGRLDPEKGPLEVLKVAEQKQDARFLVAGDGVLRKKMERIIQEKNLKNVKLLGIVDHNDLPKLYHSADVLLLPSFSEGMPVVMLEAMASEIPVIVSNVGGVGEILAENNGGYAVKPGNVDEIISKLNGLQNDKILAINLGKKGRENVISKFSNFFERQLEIYQTVISDFKS